MSKATRTGKRLLALLFALILLAVSIPATSVFAATGNTAEFAGGNGTAADPYLIATKQQLNNVRNYLDAHFKMVNDIVFSAADFAEDGAFYNERKGWLPIGSEKLPFTGSFDGGGYAIHHLQISCSVGTSSDSYNSSVGVFAYNQGEIKNLGIENSTFDYSAHLKFDSPQFSLGVLVGHNTGTITNCYSIATVSLYNQSEIIHLGGLVGHNEGTITDCYQEGKISARGQYYSYTARIGGVVGINTGTVTNCYHAGTFSPQGEMFFIRFGGIVGTNNGTVSRCYNTADFSSHAAGGIVAANAGTISDCYNTGALFGIQAGGIAATNGGGETDTKPFKEPIDEARYTGRIIRCYNIGTISCCDSVMSAFTGGNYSGKILIGGLVGNNSALIADSYNRGAVTNSSEVTDTAVGGIIGSGYFYSDYGTRYSDLVIRCYNTGTIRSTSSQNLNYVGGIAGESSTIADCYNNGNVLSDAFAEIGGISGSGNLFFNCCNTGQISTTSGLAGGIVGTAKDKIQNCYNTGQISNVSGSVGGIVGETEWNISNCYNTGTIETSATDAYAGGIVGKTTETLENCYNIGTFLAPSSTCVGGIAGKTDFYHDVKNGYFLDTAAQGIGQTNYSSDDDTTVKCTEEQLKQQATFAGFDFLRSWGIDNNYGYPYPQLISCWQEPVEGIVLLTPPTNTTALEGLAPDLSGGRVEITYNETASVQTALQPWMLHGYNPDLLGTQTVTVGYGGILSEDTITLTVLSKEIDHIAITTLPKKIIYLRGLPLQLNDAALTVYFNNTSTLTLPLSSPGMSAEENPVKVTYPKDQVGEVTVTVEYQGHTATFPITVKEREIAWVRLNTTYNRTHYLQGEELSFINKFTLETRFVSTDGEDSYSVEETITRSMISGYDKDTPGKQTLTVTGQYGTSQTFEVTVHPLKKISTFRVTSLEPTQIYFRWEDVPGAYYYQIHNITTGTYMTVNDTNESVNDYAEHGTAMKNLSPNTTYQFRIRAYTLTGEATICCPWSDVLTFTTPMETPVVKVANAATGVTVTWNKIAGAEGYYVYRSVYSGGAWSGWKRFASTKALTVTDKVSSNTVVKYTVRAYKGTTLSAYKASATIKFLAQPTVKAVGTTAGNKVTWNKITGASGYTLYYRYYKDGVWTGWRRIGNVKALSYTHTAAGYGYYFQYTARAYNGDYLSSFAASNTAIRLAQPTVKAVGATAGNKVTWNKINGAKGYTVYYRYYKSGKWTGWTKIGNTTALAYTHTKAGYGYYFQYTVKAYNGTSTSTYKASGSAVRLAQPKVSTVKSGTALKSIWTKSAGAKGYYVYRRQYNASTKKWSSWTRLATTTKLTYTDKTARKGVYYQYTAKAYNGTSQSTYAAGKQVKR